MKKQNQTTDLKNKNPKNAPVPAPPVIEVDYSECPFREFRDTELGLEFWGMGPAAIRKAKAVGKQPGSVPPATQMWIDDQTQPLPRSVRQYLHRWVRAEELAVGRWEAETVIFEDAVPNIMISEWQMSHTQVLLRSSFCRKVLSMCFMLERAASMQAEHQSEFFSCNFMPEGWRPKYHVYSPGMKAGGGTQHKPGLSKNGCYLVRLYYLGAWRCVWVSDLVPVDTSGAPLLPFSPLLCQKGPNPKARGPTTITSHYVQLWPLLLCKALMKLVAPDMSRDDVDRENVEDEPMSELNILHMLTGGMCLVIKRKVFDQNSLWDLLEKEVRMFRWDEEDEENVTSRAPKKKGASSPTGSSKPSLVSILIQDTHDLPPYHLAGVTPAMEMDLMITKIRDVPLKKPLPEPVVPQWKTYRWVDWAREHGLYDNYDCPRTRFLKVNGFLKYSWAPHLLDVPSGVSITMVVQDEKTQQTVKKEKPKPLPKSEKSKADVHKQNESQRDWVPYDKVYDLTVSITILSYPSLFEFASCVHKASHYVAPQKVPSKQIDVVTPAKAPLYIAIDSPETINMKLSINMLNPRILENSGVSVDSDIEKAHVVVEEFEWFIDNPRATVKEFVDTAGYNCVELSFLPGRHYCRLWVHSRMPYHVAMITEDNICLGTRNTILSSSVKECPWVSKFLNNLSNGFLNWIRISRTRNNSSITALERDFFTSYQPDLKWDPAVVGYPKCFRHWMFRQALQSLLSRRLPVMEYRQVCNILRRYFKDPDFGFPPKPLPPAESLRQIVERDLCDCALPVLEDFGEEGITEEEYEMEEEKEIVPSDVMQKLLQPPKSPMTSNVCEYATEDVPCGILREEIYKVLRKNEAATSIQAYWRGFWTRNTMNYQTNIPADILKMIMDNAFGNLDVLTQLMKEFFLLFPGAKYAYSMSSALGGLYGLEQHVGTSDVHPSCKWVPFFQGVYYCHHPVKVHIDINSSMKLSTVAVYNNDTGVQLPQVYNFHITYDIKPNVLGYTVMGHGSRNAASGVATEASWQLTILSSTDKLFHICDNAERCTLLPLSPLSKLHWAEFFLPNRRNILGGVHIAVSKPEAISFRAEATSRNLEMEAVLRTTTIDGQVEVLGRCQGIGEIFWPYIRLKPLFQSLFPRKSFTQTEPPVTATSAKGKSRPSRADVSLQEPKPKIYIIEVTAPNKWALSVDQWHRVIEARNSVSTTVRTNQRSSPEPITILPVPGDAFTVFECATAAGGGALAKRDDERDQLFALERREWETKEPGRNARGDMIRKQFREEFLVTELEPIKSDSPVNNEEALEEQEEKSVIKAGPSVISSESVDEVEVETEAEGLYFTLPDILRDQFEPLYFIQLCTRDMQQEESVLVTPAMTKAAKNEREMRFEAALERMHELQTYNELHVLGRQRRRCLMLQNLFVDCQWSPEIETVFAIRDDAVRQEILERQLSAAKKKAAAAVGAKSAKDSKAGKKEKH